ncbi:hypothetical protein [Pedosphaera parvula]|uniref:Uncharacterized protein n=1 Tax=Pedosphaera parvula (strain Ellin514) TaxID=320771 RepID=B9XEW3_PEDPL|nr:hypothetical protein [Pedosphaera parvula]EEF61623.1 conserved hypothetical protein [Pedosphaera parvula Ellin514]
MKAFKLTLLTAALGGILITTSSGPAADAKKDSKSYPLKTCVVSDEKLGGDMGDPYIFTYKDKNNKNDPGREVRLCCKSCLKDFNKEPAKYLKKIDDAEKSAKK